MREKRSARYSFSVERHSELRIHHFSPLLAGPQPFPYTCFVDNDFGLNLTEIVQTIRLADVVAVRFVAIGQRLLLDFRASEIDGPLVKVVDPVRSIQERYESLKRLRPRFDPPDKIVAIWWPRFVSSLETTGVWPEVMKRVSESGHSDAVRRAADTLDELLKLERDLQREAILGSDSFRTLWSRTATRR